MIYNKFSQEQEDSGIEKALAIDIEKDSYTTRLLFIILIDSIELTFFWI